MHYLFLYGLHISICQVDLYIKLVFFGGEMRQFEQSSLRVNKYPYYEFITIRNVIHDSQTHKFDIDLCTCT